MTSFEFQKNWIDALLSEGKVNGVVGKFDVYENAFWVRQDEYLSSFLPKFKESFLASASADAWMELVVHAIQMFPSQSWTISDLSENFIRYLKTEPRADVTPALIEIAEKEWSREKAIAAGEAAPSFAESLAKLSEEEVSKIRLELHPSLQRVGGWITWSLGGGVVQEKQLTASEQRNLNIIFEKVPFSEWQSLGVTDVRETSQWLQQWTQEGIIVGFKLCS